MIRRIHKCIFIIRFENVLSASPSTCYTAFVDIETTRMRLLEANEHGSFSLISFTRDSIPSYAILSHTWGKDEDEVTLTDVMENSGRDKLGYKKLEFCRDQVKRDRLRYFWIDTCCINKENSVELAEAINSMFRWYEAANRCYVYLSDVPDPQNLTSTIESSFASSRWFKRGWTLQELLAPSSVHFFSRNDDFLGTKGFLTQEIHDITGIAIGALQGMPLSQYSVNERFSWSSCRKTTIEEDSAYCLLGIFGIHMPLIYGELRDNAFKRLRKEIQQLSEPESHDSMAISRIEHFERNLRSTKKGSALGTNVLYHESYCQYYDHQARRSREDAAGLRDSVQDREERIRSFLTTDPEGDVPSIPVVPTRPQDANLEFVLFNIRTYYTMGNFDASNMKSHGRFWKDTKLAIYLVKSSKSKRLNCTTGENRGLRLLEKSSADPSSHLAIGTAGLLIELLSTLSPTNTAICPQLREILFQYLDGKARYQLTSEHPISLVIRSLKTDNGEEQVSLRALELLTNRIGTILGPSHNLTELATRRLCALLRRKGDFTKALAVGADGVRAIRTQVGHRGSLPERMLMRQLEQVYMAKQDWVSALSICFEIVGQADVGKGLCPDPAFHDECAVYTMEDIAKICECSGSLPQAAAWLKQARVSGGMAWGQTEALGHIQDKLMKLIVQIGNDAEMEFWKMEPTDVIVG
jgi:Heterokaryon incompatibility protein (HET)